MMELNESIHISKTFKQNTFRHCIRYTLLRVNDSLWIYESWFLSMQVLGQNLLLTIHKLPLQLEHPKLLTFQACYQYFVIFLPFSNNSRLAKAIRETNSRTWRRFWHLMTPIHCNPNSYHSLLNVTSSEAARRTNPSIPLAQQPPQWPQPRQSRRLGLIRR